jgi:hypothetical protein
MFVKPNLLVIALVSYHEPNLRDNVRSSSDKLKKLEKTGKSFGCLKHLLKIEPSDVYTRSRYLLRYILKI